MLILIFGKEFVVEVRLRDLCWPRHSLHLTFGAVQFRGSVSEN